MYGLKAPKKNRPQCRLARPAYTRFIRRGSGIRVTNLCGTLAEVARHSSICRSPENRGTRLSASKIASSSSAWTLAMFTGRRALHDYTATVTRLDASPRTPVTFRRFNIRLRSTVALVDWTAR